MNRRDGRLRSRAHNAVQRALRCGELKRLPCEGCGNLIGNYAHHDDYTKPLQVRWLCCSCHIYHHMPELTGKPDWNKKPKAA